MNETDLNRLLRKLGEQPRSGVGDDFSHGVLSKLANRRMILPVRLLLATTAATILFSATIGYSVARAHGDESDQSPPPSWAGFGNIELLASR